MQQKVTLSQDQAGAFAAAILPFIRDYANANREEFEEFMKQRREKKAANNKGEGGAR